MRPDIFVFMSSPAGTRGEILVPHGHEGIISQDKGRRHLAKGVYQVNAGAIFLVNTRDTFDLEPVSLGSALLRNSSGEWKPVRVRGRLVYSIVQAENFVTRLEEGRTYEPRDFENELGSLVSEHLWSFVDGEAWSAENLQESLELASGELTRHLQELISPMGLHLESFDLEAEPERSHASSKL